MIQSGPCIALRRTLLATVMAGPAGPLSAFFAAVFLAASIGYPAGLLLATPATLVAVTPLARPLRVCDGALVVRAFILREFRQPLDEIVRIEIGEVKWGGQMGYRGLAMVIHTQSKDRLVKHSLYCGKARLTQWAEAISGVDQFTGEVVWLTESRHWPGPKHYPIT